jgi:hypothetical protein
MDGSVAGEERRRHSLKEIVLPAGGCTMDMASILKKRVHLDSLGTSTEGPMISPKSLQNPHRIYIAWKNIRASDVEHAIELSQTSIVPCCHAEQVRTSVSLLPY